jgi:hypothetical protein
LNVKIDNKIAEVNGKIVEVRNDLSIEIVKVNGKIEQARNELSIEIAKINSDFSNKILEVKTDLIRWTIGLLFAQSALLLSFLKFFH